MSIREDPRYIQIWRYKDGVEVRFYFNEHVWEAIITGPGPYEACDVLEDRSMPTRKDAQWFRENYYDQWKKRMMEENDG